MTNTFILKFDFFVIVSSLLALNFLGAYKFHKLPEGYRKGIASAICLQNEFDKLCIKKKSQMKSHVAFVFFPESERRLKG